MRCRNGSINHVLGKAGFFDYQRLVSNVTLTIGLLAICLVVASLLLGMPSLSKGVVAGTVVALINLWLLTRSVTRWHRAGAGNTAFSALSLVRLISVGLVIGFCLSVRVFSPLGVLAGYGLFPVSLFIVGLSMEL